MSFFPRALVVLLLGIVPAAHAQSWDLGSSELHPSQWQAEKVRTAGSRHGHLAVWIGGQTWAARIAPDGRVLDPGGIPLGGGPYEHSDAVVASDGEDYVVAWNEGAGVTTAWIDREGHVGGPTVVASVGGVTALVSNGRTYVLIIMHWGHPSRYEAMLLDREGAAISGVLTMPASVQPLIASRNGTWLIAASTSAATGIALVDESSFPAIGEARDLPILDVLPSGPLALAASDAGYAMVRTDSRRFPIVTIIFEWFDLSAFLLDDGNPKQPRRSPGPRAPATFDIDGNLEELSLTLDGTTAYVSYRARPRDYYCCSVYPSVAHVRYIEPRGKVTAVDPGVLTDHMAVSVSSMGSLLAWVHRSDGPANHQLYAARLDGVKPGAPQHVSRNAAWHDNATIVSGGGVHLAVWSDRGAASRVAYTLLAGDGEPLTGQRLLEGKVFLDPPRAASDGQSFLVAWVVYDQARRQARATIISADGSHSPPFDLPAKERLFDLSWDGHSYVLVSTDVQGNKPEVLKISPDGNVGARVTVREADGLPMWVRADDDGLIALTYKVEGFGCLCGRWSTVRPLILDENLLPDHRLDPWRDILVEWHAFGGGFDFETGGGHRLLVWSGTAGTFALGDDGVARKLPYGSEESVRVRWTGRQFLVITGSVMGVHAPTGELLDIVDLPPGTMWADVTVDRDGVPILLVTKRVNRIPRLSVVRFPLAHPSG